MKDSIKIGIITGIAIAAIAISVIAITVPFVAQKNSSSSTSYTGVKREFWLFSDEMPEFNETKMGMPRDIFSMSTITVNKGDYVIIHFYNTESEGGDEHSFTIWDKPYSVNVDLNPGENKTITFTATTAGTFNYICTFHQPTMRGQLVVLQP
ncbi:MAG: cupredoxin domain-containing protein [Nitrososphaera sp.]|jgi:plastocyanin